MVMKKAWKGHVIICPGGAYEFLSPRESEPVIRAFQEVGWDAEVFEYSTGKNLGRQPMCELAEKVQETKREGTPLVVCGFSAGAHLALSHAVHAQELHLVQSDALILCYPVVYAQGPYVAAKTIQNLVGEGDPSFFDIVQHVHSGMPPAFIWHTGTDEEVPVENSFALAQAMVCEGVKFELMIFPEGEHGCLGNARSGS